MILLVISKAILITIFCIKRHIFFIFTRPSIFEATPSTQSNNFWIPYFHFLCFFIIIPLYAFFLYVILIYRLIELYTIFGFFNFLKIIKSLIWLCFLLFLRSFCLLIHFFWFKNSTFLDFYLHFC